MKITRTRGDTHADQFLIVSNQTKQPADLTGCSFKMTLNTKSAPTDADAPAYQLNGVIKSPTSGVVEFSPTGEQANLVGNFFYDVQMTDANGAIRTLVLNEYVYTQDITK